MSKSAAVYHPQVIEPKWQSFWEEQQLFQDTGKQGEDLTKEKMYLLFAFAYPSGSGLHVGHVESKTALDIMARYYRMMGKEVFFPVGWDAFGLPAENYAIKTGIPPAVTTKNAIDTFRRQVKRVGISYDWANEIATSHPEYYKWTQWLFVQMYQKGLAYRGTGMVNWCPNDQTVLANEQVVNGECERCGAKVIQKDLEQWYLKITQYQDELISGLDEVDWPEATKQHQLHWIGKSEGALVKFEVTKAKVELECFTTRLDTIFGVTFVVVSPEKFQELGLSKHVNSERRETIQAYLTQAAHKTEEERKIGEKNKTGVDTGLKVTHPLTNQEIPVWVADYVLAGYGTGVVMGVPAHDARDGAFAKKFELPSIEVIHSPDTTLDEKGTLVNSGEYSGLQSDQAINQMIKDHPEVFSPTTTYKLRDWLISRQRYWGAPIPIVYDPEGKPHPVKEEHLPWLLPTDVEFKPTGESPLAHSKEFVERTEKLYGKGWRPEFDTMDTFVDSSWYFLRYSDARNSAAFADKEQLTKWLPVDLYMIGPEHIVLHLLYARFFTKFLRDLGYLTFNEPFMKMRHQGMIMGPDGKKMSKSKGNVINPDEVIEKFGADTLRVYEMFMGPLEADKPWSVTAVAGVYRFLQRIYNLVSHAQWREDSSHSTAVRRLHQTIKKVTDDIPNLKFNTAIAAMMELVNIWEAAVKTDPAVFTRAEGLAFVRLVAPFAPFVAEELYQQLMQQAQPSAEQSVHLQDWPIWDEELAQNEQIIIPVQINGKVRGQLEVSPDQATASHQESLLKQAHDLEKVKPWIAGRTVVKAIYVPGKIINLVVK